MPLPATSPVSVASLTTLLAERMGLAALDGTDYWVQNELDYHVRNAISEFHTITWYWRDRRSLNLTPNPATPFYNLYDPVSGLIPITFTDSDIFTQVGHHLLEHAGPASGAYIHTLQFKLSNIADALGEQVNRMLGATRLYVLENIQAGPTPTGGRAFLDPAVLDIHRVEWQDTLSQHWSLVGFRTDDIGAYGWANGWSQAPGVPRSFMQSVTPPITIDLVPPPQNVGSISIISTTSQGYTYTGTAQHLFIPDDAYWVLTWGVLASVLMQDAQSRDYARANYAAQRFAAGIQLLKSFPCIIQSWINGIQQIPATMWELDHWQAGWRNLPPGPATQLAVVGRNLIAIVPVSANTPQTIIIDCVANSPANLSRTTAFTLSNDIVTAILNNAQHAAAFKLAGVEFNDTLPLYKEFLNTARTYISEERAATINFDALMGTTSFENKVAPYELVDA